MPLIKTEPGTLQSIGRRSSHWVKLAGALKSFEVMAGELRAKELPSLLAEGVMLPAPLLQAIYQALGARALEECRPGHV